jgi:hypothetical protein
MPAGFARRDRLRLLLADSSHPADRIEFTVAAQQGRRYYGLVVLSPLLSTPHCCDAVTVRYRTILHRTETDFHRSIPSPSQAHDCASPLALGSGPNNRCPQPHGVPWPLVDILRIVNPLGWSVRDVVCNSGSVPAPGAAERAPPRSAVCARNNPDPGNRSVRPNSPRGRGKCHPVRARSPPMSKGRRSG